MTRVYQRGDSAKWCADIKDQHGLRWRVPLFADRSASEQVARQLERLVALWSSSGGQTDPSMREWLRKLPPTLYKCVQERGLVDTEADGVRVMVAEHLDAWAQYQRDAGRTELQASQQLKLVIRVLSYNKPGEVPASGCVAIMFGFKMKK